MIPRDCATFVKKLWRQYPVVTLTGPRQSGKTTLARALFPDADYVNLEAPDTLADVRDDTRGFLRRHPAPAIFDEVQRFPELLSYVQVVCDERRESGQYILTGSHQPQLHQAISQSLAGRTGLVTLLPLSLHELRGAGIEKSRDELIMDGFMPRLYDSGIEPTQLYSDYFKTYVERDVRQLIALRDLRQFEIFVQLLAGRVGQEVNFSDIASSVGVSSTTIKSWLSVLEASFVIYVLRPYFNNFGKRLVKAPKVYFTETGLAAYLNGIRSPEQAAMHPNLGGLFENMVVMDMVKRRLNAGRDCDFYFYRAPNGLEVDLMEQTGTELRPFEIKASSTYHPEMSRNLKRFAKLSANTVLPTVIYSGKSEHDAAGISRLDFRDDDMPVS